MRNGNGRPTFEVLTASGGRHFFYRLPDGAVSAHHGAGGGVDLIFHKKGYVVGPGSVFEDGVYTVASKPPYSITVAPRWFLEIIDRVRLERRGALLAHHSSAPSSFSSGDGSPLPLNEPEWFEHGTRNDWLFAYMGRYICVDESLTELRTDFERLWQKCQWTADDPEYGQKGYQWSRHERSWYAKQEEKNNPGSLAETVKHGHGGKRKGAGRPRKDYSDVHGIALERPWLRLQNTAEKDLTCILHYFQSAFIYVQSPDTSVPIVHYSNDAGEYDPIVVGLAESKVCCVALITLARKKAAKEAHGLADEGVLPRPHALTLDEHATQDITARRVEEIVKSLSIQPMPSGTPKLGARDIDLWRDIGGRAPEDTPNCLPCCTATKTGILRLDDLTRPVFEKEQITPLRVISTSPHIIVPDAEALAWISDPAASWAPTEARRVCMLLTQHYGDRLLDAFALAVLGPSKIAFLLHNARTDSGKNVIFDLFEAAIGEWAVKSVDNEKYTKHLSADRPDFDDLTTMLTRHSIVGIHELGGQAVINALGAYTGTWIAVNEKHVAKYTALRKGTLALAGTKPMDIDWHAQGLRNRLVVLSMKNRGQALDPEDYTMLISPIGIRCVRADMALRMKRLRQQWPQGTAIAWRKHDREENEAYEDSIIRADILPPVSRFIRDNYDYDPHGRTKLGQIEGRIKQAALPTTKLGEVIQRAFFETVYRDTLVARFEGDDVLWPLTRKG